MKISTPMWTFLGGLVAVGIGLTFFLIGAQNTINNPGTDKKITTTEIIGSVLMYIGSSVSGLGFIWLVIALIANAVRGNGKRKK